jgi:hypothetical protein
VLDKHGVALRLGTRACADELTDYQDAYISSPQ